MAEPNNSKDIFARITGVEGSVQTLRADVEAKHRENRKSIHDLREGQQTMLDSFYRSRMELNDILAGLKNLPEMLDKLANANERRMGAVEKNLTELNLWRAKATGYFAGLCFVGGAIISLGYHAMHLILGLVK